MKNPWNDISAADSSFDKIPLGIVLYVLVEHDPNVEWGNDDVTPFVIKVQLGKSINPEYVWYIMDDIYFDQSTSIIPQDFTVVAWRIV